MSFGRELIKRGVTLFLGLLANGAPGVEPGSREYPVRLPLADAPISAASVTVAAAYSLLEG